jgi:diguanylate cyclase (GGDEF)-like protein/PAS domain S-box-containing protein
MTASSAAQAYGTRAAALGVSFAELVFHANDSIVVIDAKSRQIVFANPAFARLTGYSEREALGQSLGKLLQGPDTDPHTLQRIADALQREHGIRTEILNHAKDGRAHWIELHIVPLRSAAGELLHFAAITRDISQAKAAQQGPLSAATTDAVTGLANRPMFARALAREVAQARRESSALALVAFDVDAFTRIHDSQGLAIGDAVLRAVGERCQAQLRPHDVLGRIGGEMFAVLLPGATRTVANAVAERLRASLAATPVRAGQAMIGISASFGVAVFASSDDSSGEQILTRAERCMHEARDAGGNRVCREALT